MACNGHFVVRVPDNLPLEASAPLLGAGIATYRPMKCLKLHQLGMHIGVVGLGALGHLAVKFAKAFRAKVTVMLMSFDKKEEMLGIGRLGAVSFLISEDPDQMQAAMGTFDGILDTKTAMHPITPLYDLLKTKGKFVMLGAPDRLSEMVALKLREDKKLLAGSAMGGMKITQEMLDFAAKNNISADIEVIPVDYANSAMEILIRGDVKRRFVIDIGNTLKVV